MYNRSTELEHSTKAPFWVYAVSGSCFLNKSKMKLTTQQKQEWKKWLSERPENVRKVAEQIVPWKKYKDKRMIDDIGNRYSPLSYQEQEDGTVTITCEKSNKEMPILGGYGVFGMSADNLEEAD